MGLSAEEVGAFIPHGRFEVSGLGAGNLVGLRFAVKDFIDIQGHVTGAGNPRWLETHAPAVATAPCVQKLLDAGATMIGKTITDELAYSINGDNYHYGTPLNAAAPGRVPGGSSSGSAAAVAAELCDFALGTDTGGSVRIPASYCGLYGIRTTHGILPMEGVVPFMPSLDTIGWFARDAELFAQVGDILLPKSNEGNQQFRRVLNLTDIENELDPAVMSALRPAINRISDQYETVENATLSQTGLEAWRQVFRRLSASEVWSVHGEWIEAARPVFGPAIAERFAYAKEVSAEDVSRDVALRTRIGERLRELLPPDTIICLPTAPGPAPLRSASGDEVEQFRQHAQRLTCIAGLAGLPQVTMPLAVFDGAPIGLSLIGPPGSDRRLLAECVAHSARWSSEETALKKTTDSNQTTLGGMT
ncbi:amidase [Ferrovibrio terrae]|uniref:amidase n=1 Tax=Ferrovibrio terrae TaxID=2594003 RepID=UPI00313788D9